MSMSWEMEYKKRLKTADEALRWSTFSRDAPNRKPWSKRSCAAVRRCVMWKSST